jgi:hypothetical protein
MAELLSRVVTTSGPFVETPLLKAAGPFPWYCSDMPTIVFYVLAVLVVVTLFFGDARVLLPQRALTLRVFGNLFSRRLGGARGKALEGDTRAEGEGFEPPRALARPPDEPPPVTGTTLPKRLDPKTHVVLPGRPLAPVL